MWRSLFSAVLASALGFASSAQTPAPAHKPLPLKKYCQPRIGFCFNYPTSWDKVGDVFDGNGVVIAPPQKGDPTLWDGITVALVAPAPEGDEEGLGLNGIIEQAQAGMRDAGQNFQTLQRQERTVDHMPAQMLKAQYREKATGRDWIEELVFIEGPDNEIYSVALKCSPQSLAKLEPVLRRVLDTWTLPEPEPPPEDTENTAPAENKSPAPEPH